MKILKNLGARLAVFLVLAFYLWGTQYIFLRAPYLIVINSTEREISSVKPVFDSEFLSHVLINADGFPNLRPGSAFRFSPYFDFKGASLNRIEFKVPDGETTSLDLSIKLAPRTVTVLSVMGGSTFNTQVYSLESWPNSPWEM